MIYDNLYEQTEMRDEMKKRLGDVICVAPWTELDLSSGRKKKRN